MGHIALDGTKIKANASKHKAMSYGRIKAKEEALKKEINDLLKKAAKVDKEEDAILGKNNRGDELPEELAYREKRLAKIQEAKAALEAEAKADEEARKSEKEQQKGEKEKNKKRNNEQQQNEQKQADTKKDEQKDDNNDGNPSGSGSTVEKPHATKKQKGGIPKYKSQYNFTDPESRIMKNSDKAFIQGYNAQVAVDASSQVIVAAEITNQAADVNHLQYMVQSVKINTGLNPKEVSADAGYYSEDNIKMLEREGIDAYIPPDKQPHSRFKEPAPRGRSLPIYRLKKRCSEKSRLNAAVRNTNFDNRRLSRLTATSKQCEASVSFS